MYDEAYIEHRLAMGKSMWEVAVYEYIKKLREHLSDESENVDYLCSELDAVKEQLSSLRQANRQWQD